MKEKLYEVVASKIRADTQLQGILDNIRKATTADEKTEAYGKLKDLSGKGAIYAACLGFSENGQAPGITDALKDDELLNRIMSANDPETLLKLEKEVNDSPLTLFERHIYQECIESVCRTLFDTYSPKYALEEKARKSAAEAYEKTMKKSMTDAAASATVSHIEDGMEAIVAKPIVLLDDNGRSSGWYRQIVSRVDVLNDNMRLYPKSVYAAALDNLNAQNYPYPGESPHPASYKGADGKVHFRTSVSNSVVKFRKAFIDEAGYVWAEYKTLDTAKGREVQAFLDEGLPIAFSNRMTGNTVRRTLNDCTADVATKLELYCWDVVLNPAESASFGQPVWLTDAQIEEMRKSNEEDTYMDELLKMNLEQLKEWKKENANHKDMALCDHLIGQLERQAAAEKELSDMKAEKERQEKMQKTQKILYDAVEALPYPEATKQAIMKKGESLTDEALVAEFVKNEQAVIDTIAIDSKLGELGVPKKEGKAKTIMTDTNTEKNNLDVFTDNLMQAMDRELASKDVNFKPDEELRKANRAILDQVFADMGRKGDKEYLAFTKEMNDAAAGMSIVDGAITDSAISTSGDFAQAAAISRAVLCQAWQDTQFLQLCLVEGFSGSVYEMLVEFQSDDLFSEDDFVVGELEGIPTEGVETYVLKIAAEWLKRGFVITKEAMVELKTGPFKYDILIRNLASIAARFTRIIDRKISTEMLARSDEYEAAVVENETVSASELVAIVAGSNAPAETNAAFMLQLKCGNASMDGVNVLPPVVRPRTSVYLDEHGRTEKNYINDILIADSTDKQLVRGNWLSSKGQIVPAAGQESADYAVDFENAMVYFAKNTSVSADALPKVKKYSYATNISFFCIDVPADMEPAKYYNQLLEKIDAEKAYMGSAPRYVVPDLVAGSLNAMIPVKQAELFWNMASPKGTQLFQGRNFIAERFGLNYMEHNCPWDAGDSRLLMVTKNATRVGMGSPYSLEGPLPYYAKDGKITSAQQYYVSQQISIATPLVIDSKGKQYHPPYRTIKLYTA